MSLCMYILRILHATLEEENSLREHDAMRKGKEPAPAVPESRQEDNFEMVAADPRALMIEMMFSAGMAWYMMAMNPLSYVVVWPQEQ